MKANEVGKDGYIRGKCHKKCIKVDKKDEKIKRKTDQIGKRSNQGVDLSVSYQNLRKSPENDRRIGKMRKNFQKRTTKYPKTSNSNQNN